MPSLIDLWQEWLWFAAAALGLATVLSAVVYMLSELLQNDKMKGWARMELTEVFYSALIISLGITGIQLVDSVVQGGLLMGGGMAGCGGSPTSTYIPTSDYGTFTATRTYQCVDICAKGAQDYLGQNQVSVYYGVESCHMRLGIWYLREIFDEAKDFAFDIYMSYIKTSMIAEFTINIEFIFEKAGFFTFNPWKGFYTMGNKIKELVFDWAIKLMMITKFQEVLLRFISTALFPSFFVIGAMLRTFTFTRRLGGLLLAIAIALYFVFPAFYAFGALVMLDIKNDPAVQQEWLNNAEANPNHIPQPRIANTMYARGRVPMPGGGSQGYDIDEARSRLSGYESGNPNSFMDSMERGADASGQGLMPLYDPSTGRLVDFTSRRGDSATDAERDQALARSRQEADSWFATVSNESKIDKFVTFAWEPNGPIETLGRLTFWSVFFSLFSIIGTIAAIRSLSMTFGGDIEIAGLTRLI